MSGSMYFISCGILITNTLSEKNKTLQMHAVLRRDAETAQVHYKHTELPSKVTDQRQQQSIYRRLAKEFAITTPCDV